jgi:hypothetical protein
VILIDEVIVIWGLYEVKYDAIMIVEIEIFIKLIILFGQDQLHILNNKLNFRYLIGYHHFLIIIGYV